MSDDHVFGEVPGALTLVMYGDYESKKCAFLQSLVTIALRVFKGHLGVIFRHFPLVVIHRFAQHAAEMSEAAANRGRFWQMHDLLFAHQGALADEDLRRYAAEIGMDPAWAMMTLRIHAFTARVQRDFLSGVQNGVTGAPTLFINDRRYDDAYDEPSLLIALQNARYALHR